MHHFSRAAKRSITVSPAARSGIALIGAFLICIVAPANAGAQDWRGWSLVVNEDPITDRHTYSVSAQETRSLPAFVYLACNAEQSWLAFSDGVMIAHHTAFPTITVRFDSDEPNTMLISNSRHNPRFLVHWEADVRWFADNLAAAERISFRIEDGRTHSFSLTGAREAIEQLTAACTLPEPGDIGD